MSKFSLHRVGFVLVILLSASVGFAKERKALVREPVETNPSWNHSPRHYGIGLATVSGLTGTPTALSGTIQMTADDLVQGFFALGGTNGVFQIGVGGLFKHTLLDSDGTGLHVGGGLGLANIPKSTGLGGSQLAFALAGIGGIHATLPQVSHLKFSMDAGPTLTVSDNLTGLSLLALSPALGLSVIYIF